MTGVGPSLEKERVSAGAGWEGEISLEVGG